MFWRLRRLKEEDFYVFNGPLTSGRQHTDSLAGSLMIGSILMTLVLVIGNLFVFMDRITPAPLNVIILCIAFTVLGGIVILLSFIYSFQAVYGTRQSMQYSLSIWISQLLFGYLLYWIFLYIVFDSEHFHHSIEISNFELRAFIIGTYIAGVITFIISFIYLVRKIEQGKYREGTPIEKRRHHLETNIDVYKGPAIRIAVLFVSVVVAVVRWLKVVEIETVSFMAVTTTLLIVMSAILPEQIITWYCIKRFESFNFEKDSEQSSGKD